MHTNLNIKDKLQVLKAAFGTAAGGALTILLLINFIFPLSFRSGGHIQIVGTESMIGDIFAVCICAAAFYIAAFRTVHTINVTDSTVNLSHIIGTKNVQLSDIVSIKRQIGGYVYSLKTKMGAVYISSGFKGLYQFLDLLKKHNVESTEW